MVGTPCLSYGFVQGKEKTGWMCMSDGTLWEGQTAL